MIIFNPKLQRRGAVLPLFALLLPILVILCGLAVNTAYVQLISTEMKIATDCAAHAGGRAMSISQSTEAAYSMIEANAAANTVGGYPLGVTMTEDFVQFGRSTRQGQGRYDFTQVARSAVDNGSARATSISVLASMEVPMLFNAIPGHANVAASRKSVAMQVDRDIALVLDRSGSMLFYKDEVALNDALWDLYNTWESRWVDGYWNYHWYWGWYWVNGYWTYDRKISWSEYDNATDDLYDRWYSNNVINSLNDIDSDMYEYTYDHRYSSTAYRHSRWFYLDMGVDAFLNVLDDTDQEEYVSLVTFASDATLEYSLKKDYTSIRDKVATMSPYGATAVGTGMETGLPPIISGSNARPFAAKTIVVLTDGVSNTGTDPVTAVEGIVDDEAVTIHTVTFTQGADQDKMEDVADAGGGKHYHAEDGEELVEIFEEIANNLPTILTQ